MVKLFVHGGSIFSALCHQYSGTQVDGTVPYLNIADFVTKGKETDGRSPAGSQSYSSKMTHLVFTYILLTRASHIIPLELNRVV